MTSWKLEDAKNRFSEVVRRAEAHGPQFVTRHGRDAVVILSREDYERLASPRSLVDFLQQSPLAEVYAAGQELDLSRPGDPGRDIEL